MRDRQSLERVADYQVMKTESEREQKRGRDREQRERFFCGLLQIIFLP